MDAKGHAAHQASEMGKQAQFKRTEHEAALEDEGLEGLEEHEAALEDDALDELETMTIQGALSGKNTPRRRAPVRRRRTRRRAPSPVTCIWGGWVNGACSASCGGGTMTKTRTKTRNEAYGGGCSGQAYQSGVSCNTAACPVDCIWGVFVDGACSVSCGGGTMTKTRPKSVVEANGGACAGQSTTTVSCAPQACPVHVNCEWGEWELGTCSKPCGGGVMTNTRKKTVQEENLGTCEGRSFETDVACNVDPCPITCTWGAWVPGECSVKCGGGEVTNTREKTVVEANGGVCEGLPTETVACNTDECTEEEDLDTLVKAAARRTGALGLFSMLCFLIA